MADDKVTDHPTKRPPQPRTEQVQMLGVDPELIQDIRDALRDLPHKQVEPLLQRLKQCQVINVTMQLPDLPPGANGRG